MSTAFLILQCQRDDCRLRFPVSAATNEIGSCPLCGGSTQVVVESFLGHRPVMSSANDSGPVIDVLLDNVRSSHNVGSIFRSCDGVGINHVHLCGITSTPKNVKVSKTALGAGQTVPWTYYRNGVETIRILKGFGFSIWTLESTASGTPIFDIKNQAVPKRIVVVVGNEQSGVDPGIMALSDRIITLPMRGIKSSLNVSVALGVTGYWLRYGLGTLATQS